MKRQMVRPLSSISTSSYINNTQPRVHFSPVVSQFRYQKQSESPTETQHYNLFKPPNLPSHSSASSSLNPRRGSDPLWYLSSSIENHESDVIERVTIQEMSIPHYQTQTVQRIQVTVPSENGVGSERLSIDMNLSPSECQNSQPSRRQVQQVNRSEYKDDSNDAINRDKDNPQRTITLTSQQQHSHLQTVLATHSSSASSTPDENAIKQVQMPMIQKDGDIETETDVDFSSALPNPSFLFPDVVNSHETSMKNVKDVDNLRFPTRQLRNQRAKTLPAKCEHDSSLLCSPTNDPATSNDFKRKSVRKSFKSRLVSALSKIGLSSRSNSREKLSHDPAETNTVDENGRKSLNDLDIDMKSQSCHDMQFHDASLVNEKVLSLQRQDNNSNGRVHNVCHSSMRDNHPGQMYYSHSHNISNSDSKGKAMERETDHNYRTILTAACVAIEDPLTGSSSTKSVPQSKHGIMEGNRNGNMWSYDDYDSETRKCFPSSVSYDVNNDYNAPTTSFSSTIRNATIADTNSICKSLMSESNGKAGDKSHFMEHNLQQYVNSNRQTDNTPEVLDRCSDNTNNFLYPSEKQTQDADNTSLSNTESYLMFLNSLLGAEDLANDSTKYQNSNKEQFETNTLKEKGSEFYSSGGSNSFSGNNFLSDSAEIPPIPKPRVKKALRLGVQADNGEDIDELSANVENILEEIAGLDYLIDNPEDTEQIEDFHSPNGISISTFNEKSESMKCNKKPLMESNGFSVYDSPKHQSATRCPNAMKPPLPPSSRGMRQQFFKNGQSYEVGPSSGGGMSGLSTPTAPFHLRADKPPAEEAGTCAAKLDEKLSEFRYELHRSREELARSYPKVEDIENSVRSSMLTDRCGGTLPPNRVRTDSKDTRRNYSVQNASVTRDRESSEKDRDTQIKWATLLSQATKNYLRLAKGNNGPPCPYTFPKGVVETDLDTGRSREIHTGQESDCKKDWKYGGQRNVKNVNSSCHSVSLNQKTRSMMNLGSSQQMSTLSPSDPTASRSSDDRARSMEFLMDDSSKNAHLRPPENTLMSRQENRQPSEHELRIQRSLQKLNVPDWYKSYVGSGSKTDTTKPAAGGQKEFGSGTGLAGGWSGLASSKTSSLTSLQSTGRYSGSRSHFSRFRSSGTASAGGRSSRESLMSPSSTASASPSPYYERSSFTYGMPYALTRFASARMSCGASPASLSPSPSPVGGIGSSTSTPVSSGPMSRHAYTKQPYLGWRSQERLNSKTMYRSPSERLAADLLAQKSKASAAPVVDKDKDKPEINIETSPKESKATASDLSLNNSEESNSHKLNRVRSSIKEVSNAIVDYVNESKPLDDGTNGGTSPRKGLVWLESSFVGTKPIDSPSTPDTPTVILSSNRSTNIQRFDFTHNQQQQSKKSNFRFDEANRENYHVPSNTNSELAKSSDSASNPTYNPSYLSRNEQMEERSNSSSVSSPTLEDILDSLLALRRPNKKIRSRGKGHVSSSKEPPKPPPHRDPTPISDWQDRMNQPLEDSAYFPDPNDFMRTMPMLSNNSQQQPVEPEEQQDLKVADSPSRAENFSTTTTASLKDLDDKSPRSAIDDFEMIDKEESAFGTHTEIHSSSCATNAAPSNESNPPTPRHRRVSFDLDISDKEEKSSSRSRRDESVGGTIHCRNSKCGKSATGLEARREFKTCHNCNAYYCTRECRRAHWEKHKKVCMQSRVGALCKQIINHVKEDSFVVSQLSAVAKRGYLAKSRGCVKLFFSSPDRAERFLTGGLPELPEPWYIPHGDMLPEEMGASTFQELSDQCRTYNTENRFVLYVSVCVVNEVPTSGAVKWEREMISRSAKLRLLLPRSYEENQRHHHAAAPSHFLSEDSHPDIPFYDSTSPASVTEDASPLPSSDNDTLILRSVPALSSQQLSSSDHRKIREVSFANIQKHLNERGVDLRRTYPDIYSKLISYVEHDEPFVAVTIYPRNAHTGRQFICVIMPESSDSVPYTSAESNSSSRTQTIDISEQS